jgi:serine/threonine protein kinase
MTGLGGAPAAGLVPAAALGERWLRGARALGGEADALLVLQQGECQEGKFRALAAVLAALLVLVVAGGLWARERLIRKYLEHSSGSWKVRFSDVVLGKKLGEGAFAVVYKAKWHGKDVAIKVFREEKFSEMNVSTFILEVAILNELRHPNIVLFMGACFEKPKLAIITELLKCSLYDLILQLAKGSKEQSKDGKSDFAAMALQMPWIDRIQILIDAALGMAYLHEIGMMHHDLKSPNLLLGTYHNCKVADFGMISVRPGLRKKQLLKKSTEFFDTAVADNVRGRDSGPFSPVRQLTYAFGVNKRAVSDAGAGALTAEGSAAAVGNSGSGVGGERNITVHNGGAEGAPPHSPRAAHSAHSPPATPGSPHHGPGAPHSGPGGSPHHGPGTPHHSHTIDGGRPSAEQLHRDGSCNNLPGGQRLFAFDSGNGSSGAGTGSSTSTRGAASATDLLPGPGKPHALGGQGGVLGRLGTKKFDPFKDAANNGGGGTPQWTSPEVIEGGEYTDKADVFSLGIIMAEVCNLAEPYPGMTAFEVSIKVVENQLRPALNDQTPTSVAKLARACMAQHPKDRPTMAYAACELQEILQGWMDSSAPDTLPSRFKQQATKSQHRASLTLVTNLMPKGEPQDPFVEQFGAKPWWLDDKMIKGAQSLSKDAAVELQAGIYDPVKRMPSRRRLSLGHPFGDAVAPAAPAPAPPAAAAAAATAPPASASPVPLLGSMLYSSGRGMFKSAAAGAENKYLSPGESSAKKALATGSVIFGALRGGAAALGGGGGGGDASRIASGTVAVHPVDTSPRAVYIKTITYGMRTDLVNSFAKDMDKRFALTHKNVAQVIGAWINAKTLSLVIERPSHGSLRDIMDHEAKAVEPAASSALATTAPAPAPAPAPVPGSGAQRLRIRELLEVVDAMRYLHSREVPVVHKDLRCHNIWCFEPKSDLSPVGSGLLTGSGSLGQPRLSMKLAGFLFESVTKAFSKEEQKIGVPAWSPPEVIMGEQYSKEGDVYSLGISLWESFTRGRPFEGLNWQDLGRTVCMEQKRPPWPAWSAQFNCDADNYAKLMQLVDLLWHGDPKKRPNIEKVKLLLSQIKTCKPASAPAYAPAASAPANAPASVPVGVPPAATGPEPAPEPSHS